jgi:hypothetical protein
MKMKRKVDPAIFAEQVRLIRAAVEKLRVMGADFPAVDRNALRMLASLKMIELNLEDAA